MINKKIWLMLLLVLLAGISFGANPVITLNYPINGQNLTSDADVFINYTVSDSDSNPMTVEVFISENSTTGLDDLIYRAENVPTGNQTVLNVTSLSYQNYSDHRTLLMLKFDNFSSRGENSTYTVDYSSYLNNMSKISGNSVIGAFINSSGRYGSGLNIRDASSYGIINHSNSLALQTFGNWTLSIWVNPVKIDGTKNILSQEDLGGTGRSYLSLNSSGLPQTVTCGPVQPFFNQSALQVNNWYNVVLVMNDTGTATTSQEITGYVNGVRGMTQNCTDPQLTTGVIRIGTSKTGANPFNGTIDELLIINKTLNDQEVRNLYSTHLADGDYFYNVSVVDSASETKTANTNFLIGNYCSSASYGKPFVSAVTNTTARVSVIFSNSTDAYISYGTSPGSYQYNTSVSLSNQKNTSIGFTLTNLVPNARTYYQAYIRPNGTEVYCPVYNERNFTTTKPKGVTFNFAFESDSHIFEAINNSVTGLPDFNKTVTQINSFNPDFIMDGGDTVMTHYGSGTGQNNANTQEKADYRYLITRNIFADSYAYPIYMTLGNHEGEFDMGTFNDHNSTLTNHSATARLKYWVGVNNSIYPYGGSNDLNPHTSTPLENYFAFDYGDATFIVLDSYRYSNGSQITDDEQWTLGENQFNWLNQTLQASNKKWKFLYAHHILGGEDNYTTDSYMYGDGGGNYSQTGNQSYGQQAINPLMERYNAQFFIFGHSHMFNHDWANFTNYNRSLYVNYILSSTQTEEVCVNANRNSLYTNRICQRGGYVQFAVSPYNVSFSMINATGTKLYNYTVNNTAPIINYSYDDGGTINDVLSFRYNDTEWDTAKGCTLYVDNTPKYITVGNQAGEDISVNLSEDLELSNGQNFNWFVNCSDGALETVTSTKNSVAVLTSGSSGGGLTCNANWFCYDYGDCNSNGFQYRTCIDLNNCNTLSGKPVEQLSCEYNPGIIEIVQNKTQEFINDVKEGNKERYILYIAILVFAVLILWLIISKINKNYSQANRYR